VGNIYVSSPDSVVRKIAADGTISTYAGAFNRYGFSGDGGPATSAALAAPKGMAVDSAGNLYIADDNNDRVRVVSPH
jgi:sugar lactone lactonase YvrE